MKLFRAILLAAAVLSACPAFAGFGRFTRTTTGTPFIPNGVTLRQIDGGPTFYADHGYTKAAQAGWDSPSFFPIGPWLAPVTTAGDVTRWQSLKWNTAFSFQGQTDKSLFGASSGLWMLPAANDTTQTSGIGSETVGILLADEPQMWPLIFDGPMNGWAGTNFTGYIDNTANGSYTGVAGTLLYAQSLGSGSGVIYPGAILSGTSIVGGTTVCNTNTQTAVPGGYFLCNLSPVAIASESMSTGSYTGLTGAQQAGRFNYINQFLHDLNGATVAHPASGQSGNMTSIMAWAQVNTAGIPRIIDAQSIDAYWITAGKATVTFVLGDGGTFYGLGRSMTNDEAQRGSHYGDVVDGMRASQTTYPHPIFNIIENGNGALSEASLGAQLIYPAEYNWAAWSSVIHGARGLVIFNITCCGTGTELNDNMSNAYYSTNSNYTGSAGLGTNMFAQSQATHGLIQTFAPIINSRFALSYVSSVSPLGYMFPTANLTINNGIDLMVKYYTGNSGLPQGFWIFATTRNSESGTNISATFTLNDPKAVKVTRWDTGSAGATINVSGGQFTDTFANAWTVHIYHVEQK